MTTGQVFEMSVTVNNNSVIQDYLHLDDQTQPTFEIIIIIIVMPSYIEELFASRISRLRARFWEIC